MEIHATALLIGRFAVLLRGAPGAGKSQLARRLLHDSRLPFVRLIADDRVCLTAMNGRLIAKAHPAIAGLVELRGFGLLHVPFAEKGVVKLDVLLTPERAERMPEPMSISHCGICVAHMLMGQGCDAAAVIVAFLQNTGET